ncbi:MAG: UDP-N-acetylmuramate--L-alanine ligase [Clostridia bacterium]|nr:UDP-N-acetylmuramate--L-alanine ligase [Clostridia bacterium]
MKRFDISELKPESHIHFIGIGGISMSGIAQIMLQNGYKVTGSDWNESNITNKLSSLGATVYIGHAEENVNGADLVVYTAAAHGDNPEIIASKKQGIRLIDRAEMLGAIMKTYKNCVGVAGTHGKTTTTSMLAHALINADLDPTISIGGELDLIDGNIRTGSGEFFVTEACEYTNSFLKFFPTVSLITNIEEDHLDFFKDLDDIINSFRSYALLTKENGVTIAWGEDENIRKALDNSGCKVIYYGIGDFEYSAENIIYVDGYPQFDCFERGEKLCNIKLNVPGEHNVQNALATVAVCRLLGADLEKAVKGIESFKGTHRRFEQKGFCNGAVVIDDYAHHPTEIKATLTAASSMPHGRILCIFEPHTYTRTKTLWDEFLTAFDKADEIILSDIYAARELPDGETTSEALAEAMKNRGVNAKYIKGFDNIVQYIKENARKGDIIFTMGAGTVTQLGPMICD